jgi:dTDP-4-amino-4,6-dideoxygalactose transaminase
LKVDKKKQLNFIDLDAQQTQIRAGIDRAIQNVLDHGQYILGPEVSKLENALANFAGAKHAIGCANGTDALTIVLMAWGVGAGDAVFVPSFTYVASAEAPAQLGATPFFVDTLRETFNIDPESFARAIAEAKNQGLRPAAVVAVDLFGLPADADAIQQIAREHGVKVLVDGAQSFGAERLGKKVGVMGDATTTSFFPAKPLGCYGDGGAIFTNDSNLAAKMSSIHLQAAILLEKLKIFPNEITLRGHIARHYHARLSDVVKVPHVPEGYSSVWAQYTLRLGPRRDAVKKHLDSLKIPSVIYYPKALTQQDGYTHFPVVSTKTIVSESLSREVLSLPMHPYLNQSQIDYICDAIVAVC